MRVYCTANLLYGVLYLLDQASKLHPFPCPTTYRTALTHYVDITSSPRTNVLKELADHATDPKEKEFLLKITSASEEGKVSASIGCGGVVSGTCVVSVGVCACVHVMGCLTVPVYCLACE